jgi:hypothetical protein
LITLHDLDTAIAKCQGETNPNANTCIKLAAFYTIRQEMFGGNSGGEEKPVAAPAVPGYSTAPGPVAQEQAETIIDFDSGSEFSRAIDGRDAYSVWAVMDELMDVLNATNPRLFDGVMRKIHEI